MDPYSGQWLEIDLERVRPVQGRNRLEIALTSRPTDLVSAVTLEDVEMTVDYGVYPSGRLP